MKAYRAMDDRSEYRRLVETKLGALGGDVKSVAGAAPVAAAPGTAKP
jgi:hypothetical protein